MVFFKKAGKRSYDLFSNYCHYVPGIGGMFMMLLLFLVGSILGSILTVVLSLISPDFANIYGMKIGRAHV